MVNSVDSFFLVSSNPVVTKLAVQNSIIIITLSAVGLVSIMGVFIGVIDAGDTPDAPSPLP